MRKTTIGILALALMGPMAWGAQTRGDDEQRNRARSVETEKPKAVERAIERPAVRDLAGASRIRANNNEDAKVKATTPAESIRPKVIGSDPRTVGRTITPPPISAAAKVKANEDDEKNQPKVVRPGTLPPSVINRNTPDDDKNKVKAGTIRPGTVVTPPVVNRNTPDDDKNKVKAGTIRPGTVATPPVVNKNTADDDKNKARITNRFQRPEPVVRPLPRTATPDKTITKAPDSAVAKPVTTPPRVGPAVRGNARVPDVAPPKITQKPTIKPTKVVPTDPATAKVQPSNPAASKVVAPVRPVAPAATRVRAPRSAVAAPKTVTNTVVVNKKVVNYTEINRTVINERVVSGHRHRDFVRPSYVRHDYHPRSSLDISFGFVSGGFGDSFAFGFHYSEGGHLGYRGFGRCYDYSSFSFGLGFSSGGDVAIAAAFGYGPPPPVVYLPPPPPPVVVVADPYACYPVWYRPAVVVLPPPPPPVAVVAVAPPPPPPPVVVAVDALSCYPRWYRPSGIAVSAAFNINDSAAEAPAENVGYPGAQVPPQPAAEQNTVGNASDNTGITTPALPDANTTADASEPTQDAAVAAPPAYDYGRITLEGEIRFRNE